jgi:macrolide transport system ATP-binding/permease protein
MMPRWFRKRRDRRSMTADLSEELQQHLEEKVEALVAQGMPREEAVHAARRAFGNATLLEQRSREVWMWPLVESIGADIKFALRQLRKSPGLAITAVLTLALGFGATTAIFAFVDAALIRPLPYRNPSRLMYVTESVPMFPRANLSYLDYVDWKRFNKVFSSFDVWTPDGYMLRTPAGTQLTPGIRVSDNFFRTLGVQPLLGRDFYSGEDLPSAPQTVMLSYTAWQKYFAGKRNVIGHTVLLTGVQYSIIGVLPRSFQFAPRGNAEFWAALHPAGECENRRSCHDLYGVARLKNGISAKTALADMTSIAQQLEKQYPGTNRGQGAFVAPLSEVIVGNIRPILLMLLAGAGLLLLIASVNVSSLLLVRSEGRRREIAVRGALGASPARLIRQFIAEGLVLVITASLLGLTAAYGAMHLLGKLIPEDMLLGMPYLQGLGLNPHVLVFVGVIALLTAILFALTPIVRLPLTEMQVGLTEGGRGSAGRVWRRLGTNLVVLELTIAMVLLVCAGLLGKSFYRLLHVELGFQPEHLAAVQEVMVPNAIYKTDQQVVALARQIIRRISILPGVQSAAIGSRLPVGSNGNTTWFRVVGHPYHGEHNEVPQRDVSAGYFTTLQARLLRGRYFTDGDDLLKPGVVIINQALAKKYFPGEDPIGKQIGDDDLSPKSIVQVVGIVDDIREGSLDSEIVPAIYYPYNQSPDHYFSIVVRTSQDARTVLPALVAKIGQIAPSVGLASETTMRQKIGSSPSAYLHRSSAWLVGGFAAMALLLSVIGLYGVVAYSVGQRTREIGIRIALGAQRGSVYRLIMGETGWLAGIGIAAGIVCSIAAATLMRSLLFDTHAWDFATLAIVSVLLAVTALLAGYFPARRAASIDPMQALRSE